MRAMRCVVLFAIGLATMASQGQDTPPPKRETPDVFPEFPRFPLEQVPGVAGNPFFERFFGKDATQGEDAELEKISISLREEEEYGEQVWQSFQEEFKRRGIPTQTRGREVEYLRRIVATLRPHWHQAERYRSLRLVYVDSEQADAYSIPGGTILVFRGMFDVVDSEAALAGVLGHELSHLSRGHQLRPLRRMKYVRETSQRPPGDFSAMFRQANVFAAAFLRPFRPEDEAAADRDGATWAFRAGYDPRAMGVLFAKMAEREVDGGFTPSFLRTHPYHADRQAAVEELFRQLSAKEPRRDLYLGRTNLRELVSMSQRRFAE